MLRYGRHCLDEADIARVVEALRSEWITTGPRGEEFEEAFAALVGARRAVALSSGTAALHACMNALRVGPGDEVVVPAMTFAATANSVVFQGATPVFADVEADTLLLGPTQAEERITPRTKAIVAVDYAGQPCDYDGLRSVAERHGVALVADACHALGARYKGRAVGGLADMSAFSLHPVKHITTGEGGVVTTDQDALASRIRSFRNHGINNDNHRREALADWFYEVVELGYNYRLTDFQCALGLSQLDKLPGWVARRRQIARRYDAALAGLPATKPLGLRPDVDHAYHLYVARLELESLAADRASLFKALRAEGIGVNVHYIPVHLHPFYRERFGTGPGLCPAAEKAYEEVLSLPIFPAMSEADVEDVVEALGKVLEAFSSVRV